MKQFLDDFHTLIKRLEEFDTDTKINILNHIRLELNNISPFKDEPVDCVIWVKNDTVTANDYNPNSVAPKEMALLQHSINMDGYTQPIVTWRKDDIFEVVDGFHRYRVGRECEDVNRRVQGYLPIVVIKKDREGRNDRMAATIRHNRARGSHKVGAMSDIVVELKRRRWSNDRIALELGMEQDEVIRLLQITGIADLFKEQEFSEAWELEDSILAD